MVNRENWRGLLVELLLCSRLSTGEGKGTERVCIGSIFCTAMAFIQRGFFELFGSVSEFPFV